MIHAILDNYATHKHPKVRAWLATHPRWTFHFTPTSACSLNAVEGFFAKLTRRRLKRGIFRSVVELQEAINRFVESIGSWRRQMPTPSPSCGQLIPIGSSPPSNGGNKCSKQSTRSEPSSKQAKRPTCPSFE
jgi:hypothetical protein